MCHVIFCGPTVLYSLNFITETVQVTEGCTYFPQGTHVGQAHCRMWVTIITLHYILLAHYKSHDSEIWIRSKHGHQMQVVQLLLYNVTLYW
jgi:hypothetical protein